MENTHYWVLGRTSSRGLGHSFAAAGMCPEDSVEAAAQLQKLRPRGKPIMALIDCGQVCLQLALTRLRPVYLRAVSVCLQIVAGDLRRKIYCAYTGQFSTDFRRSSRGISAETPRGRKRRAAGLRKTEQGQVWRNR